MEKFVHLNAADQSPADYYRRLADFLESPSTSERSKQLAAQVHKAAETYDAMMRPVTICQPRLTREPAR